MDYSTSFYDDYGLMEIFVELEKHKNNPDYKIDMEKFQSQVAVYLQWVESIASLVERNVIDFYTIDNIIAYRFFLLVNNKQVQDTVLVKNADFYRGTYYLYDRWYNYELKRGLKMPLEETALHLSENYASILEQIKKGLH